MNTEEKTEWLEIEKIKIIHNLKPQAQAKPFWLVTTNKISDLIQVLSLYTSPNFID